MTLHIIGLAIMLLTCPGLQAQKVDVKKMKTKTFFNKKKLPLAQVNVAWLIEDVTCRKTPTVKQRFKGYIKRGYLDENEQMVTDTVTAEEIVKKATQRNKKATDEVKDFWKEIDREGHKDTSLTNYISDIGAHGTSCYNDVTNALSYDQVKGELSINDTPGTNAAVGETGIYQMAEIKLQFETTVICDGAVVLVFEWSLEYTLPAPEGEKPKPKVTLISQK